MKVLDQVVGVQDEGRGEVTGGNHDDEKVEGATGYQRYLD